LDKQLEAQPVSNTWASNRFQKAFA